MSKKELYFCGNKVSEYGQEHNRVDYATFAKAFDAVLNNGIMSTLENAGYYFEQVGGMVDNSEEIEELQEQIDELEELDEITEEVQEKIDALQEQIDELEEEQEPGEVFQWFIVSDNAVDILEMNNEIVYYCEEVDMYLWGVTHWGTGWDYVLTDIRYDENGYIIR